MNYILRFDAKATKLGIFFNDTAALKSKFSLTKSKVKDISLAVYKNKIVGMEFNSTKVTDYEVISGFLIDHLKIREEETEAILSQIIGLSVRHTDEISDTLH
jgi:hypothetical protein